MNLILFIVNQLKCDFSHKYIYNYVIVLDFFKEPDPKDFPKISMVWKSIPSQLARENKKFIYKVIKDGARARALKGSKKSLKIKLKSVYAFHLIISN